MLLLSNLERLTFLYGDVLDLLLLIQFLTLFIFDQFELLFGIALKVFPKFWLKL